jgi:hypothetical protein
MNPGNLRIPNTSYLKNGLGNVDSIVYSTGSAKGYLEEWKS